MKSKKPVEDKIPEGYCDHSLEDMINSKQLERLEKKLDKSLRTFIGITGTDEAINRINLHIVWCIMHRKQINALPEWFPDDYIEVNLEHLKETGKLQIYVKPEYEWIRIKHNHLRKILTGE